MSETNQTTTTDANDFFGTAKYTSGTEYFNLEDGDNVFRFAPPVKSLRTEGKWSTFGAMHYGYTIPSQKNPDKPFSKPFVCIQKKNWDTKMIIEECPECSLIAVRQAAYDRTLAAKKAEFLAKGAGEKQAEEQAKQAMKGIARWFREHNVDRKHYVLAKKESGVWGVLKFGSKTLDAIKAAFAAYTKKTGKDALDHREGVWVTINRSGKDLATVYTAAVTMVEDANTGAFRFKTGALTQADIQAITSLPDLSTILDRSRLTYEQIATLAKSDNNPEVTTKIFARAETTPVSAPPVYEDDDAPSAPTPVAAAPVPATTNGAPKAQTPAEALAAQVAALQLQLAALSGAQNNTATTPPPSAESEMSLEDFKRDFS